MNAFHAAGDYGARAVDVAMAFEEASMGAAFTDPEAMVRFATAGNATLTVQGNHARYTFKIVRAKRRPGQGEEHAPWYVSGLTGPDNEADYRHLGTLFPSGGYIHSRKSPLDPSAPIPVAATWFFLRIHDPAILTKVQVYHEGRCGRCGRKLTVPESVVSGFGPVCGAMILLLTVLAVCPVKVATGGAPLTVFAATPAVFAEHPRTLYTDAFWYGAILTAATVMIVGLGGDCESPDRRR